MKIEEPTRPFLFDLFRTKKQYHIEHVILGVLSFSFRIEIKDTVSQLNQCHGTYHQSGGHNNTYQKRQVTTSLSNL